MADSELVSELISEFCTVTGQDANRARMYLEANGWKSDLAISSYFEEAEEGPEEEMMDEEDLEEEMMNQPTSAFTRAGSPKPHLPQAGARLAHQNAVSKEGFHNCRNLQLMPRTDVPEADPHQATLNAVLKKMWNELRRVLKNDIRKQMLDAVEQTLEIWFEKQKGKVRDQQNVGRGRGRGEPDGNLIQPNFGNNPGNRMDVSEIQYAVPAYLCRFVIGKGGKTIKSINQTCGAYVALSRSSQPPEEKIFVIRGQPRQIKHAENLINESIGGQATVIMVPKQVVGVVIGKRGRMINEIQQDSGARVQFENDKEEGPDDKVCVVMGNPDQIQAASAKINNLIQSLLVRDQQNVGRGQGREEAEVLDQQPPRVYGRRLPRDSLPPIPESRQKMKLLEAAERAQLASRPGPFEVEQQMQEMLSKFGISQYPSHLVTKDATDIKGFKKGPLRWKGP